MATKKKSAKKVADMDPKARAKKVKGGSSLWNDVKGDIPLGHFVDKQGVKRLQNSGKTINKVIKRTFRP